MRLNELGRVGDSADRIQILNVSPFSADKYKRGFTNADQACEVDGNRTSACILKYKTRKRLVFDLLTCYLFIFLRFLFFSYTAITM